MEASSIEKAFSRSETITFLPHSHHHPASFLITSTQSLYSISILSPSSLLQSSSPTSIITILPTNNNFSKNDSNGESQIDKLASHNSTFESLSTSDTVKFSITTSHPINHGKNDLSKNNRNVYSSNNDFICNDISNSIASINTTCIVNNTTSRNSSSDLSHRPFKQKNLTNSNYAFLRSILPHQSKNLQLLSPATPSILLPQKLPTALNVFPTSSNHSQLQSSTPSLFDTTSLSVEVNNNSSRLSALNNLQKPNSLYNSHFSKKSPTNSITSSSLSFESSTMSYHNVSPSFSSTPSSSLYFPPQTVALSPSTSSPSPPSSTCDTSFLEKNSPKKQQKKLKKKFASKKNKSKKSKININSMKPSKFTYSFPTTSATANTTTVTSTTTQPYKNNYMTLRQNVKNRRQASVDDQSSATRHKTREMSKPLKQWLYKHRDSPYPTRQEKQHLSLQSSMTLTQVSNWFANARRRLKNTVPGPSNLSWSSRVKLYQRFVKCNKELVSSDELEKSEDSDSDFSFFEEKKNSFRKWDTNLLEMNRVSEINSDDENDTHYSFKKEASSVGNTSVSDEVDDGANDIGDKVLSVKDKVTYGKKDGWGMNGDGNKDANDYLIKNNLKFWRYSGNICSLESKVKKTMAIENKKRYQEKKKKMLSRRKKKFKKILDGNKNNQKLYERNLIGKFDEYDFDEADDENFENRYFADNAKNINNRTNLKNKLNLKQAIKQNNVGENDKDEKICYKKENFEKGKNKEEDKRENKEDINENDDEWSCCRSSSGFCSENNRDAENYEGRVLKECQSSDVHACKNSSHFHDKTSYQCANSSNNYIYFVETASPFNAASSPMNIKFENCYEANCNKTTKNTNGRSNDVLFRENEQLKINIEKELNKQDHLGAKHSTESNLPTTPKTTEAVPPSTTKSPFGNVSTKVKRTILQRYLNDTLLQQQISNYQDKTTYNATSDTSSTLLNDQFSTPNKGNKINNTEKNRKLIQATPISKPLLTLTSFNHDPKSSQAYSFFNPFSNVASTCVNHSVSSEQQNERFELAISARIKKQNNERIKNKEENFQKNKYFDLFKKQQRSTQNDSYDQTQKSIKEQTRLEKLSYLESDFLNRDDMPKSNDFIRSFNKNLILKSRNVNHSQLKSTSNKSQRTAQKHTSKLLNTTFKTHNNSFSNSKKHINTFKYFKKSHHKRGQGTNKRNPPSIESQSNYHYKAYQRSNYDKNENDDIISNHLWRKKTCGSMSSNDFEEVSTTSSTSPRRSPSCDKVVFDEYTAQGMHWMEISAALTLTLLANNH